MNETRCDVLLGDGVVSAGIPIGREIRALSTKRSPSVDQVELNSPLIGGSLMKRISLFAVAALVFAGAQLHAQGATKQDSSKKAAKTATAAAKTADKAASAAKSDAKTADKAASAAKSDAKTATKAAAKADSAAGTAPKKKSGGKKKAAAKKDSTSTKKP